MVGMAVTTFLLMVHHNTYPWRGRKAWVSSKVAAATRSESLLMVDRPVVVVAVVVAVLGGEEEDRQNRSEVKPKCNMKPPSF